ncbi:MAG: hypothetical protein DME58_02135 [Verrucomicrobia bacterium]|nr:MAG: hypothetical protein DME58_02135 [Verrucomicrobiota bacterium]
MRNPAHRLHNILTRSKAVQNKNMLQGWREVLSLPQDMSELIVMIKVGKVFLPCHQLSRLTSRDFPT